MVNGYGQPSVCIVESVSPAAMRWVSSCASTDRSCIGVGDESGFDEPAPHRIPDLFVDGAALRVECLTAHAVGMRGEAVPDVDDHIMVVIEGDRLHSGEPYGAALVADAVHIRKVIRIHGLRVVAFQTSHGSAVRAVPQPGERKRPIQCDAHAVHLIDHVMLHKRFREPVCGKHRADGMRRTRSHTDGIQIEDAEHIHEYMCASS